MKDHPVITGVGVISALGHEPAVLSSSDSAIQELTELNERQLLEPGKGAPIVDFEPTKYLGERNLRPLDRAGRFAASAAHLALESAGWTTEMREVEELDLVVGTTFCSARTIMQFDHTTQTKGPKFAKPLDFANTVINAAGGQTAIWQKLRGANITVSAGRVSSIRALKLARHQIERNSSAATLVGGVEELCFETYTAFQQAGHKSILGEGAAFLVVERKDDAEARGATIHGQLMGCGSSYDLSRGADKENAEARLTDCIDAALTDAEIEANDIDCISCSGFENEALDKKFSDAVPRLAIGEKIGDTLGASGLMQTIAFLESSGQTGLIVSQGFDGSSAAAVIRAAT